MLPFSGMSAPEKNYKDTILLPETGFPMRGDLTKNEPVRLKKWEDTGLYERILSRRIEQGAPRFPRLQMNCCKVSNHRRNSWSRAKCPTVFLPN